MNEYKSLLEVENEFEDSNLDRVIPNESDFTSQERHLPLSEVYKTYTYRQELVNQILKDPEPSIGTKIGAGLKRGADMAVDFLPQMRELFRRSLNGHTMPNMTEKQAEDLLAAGTRSLMADKQARAIVEQYKGVDDSFITDVFGAASSAGILLISGALAGLTGGSSVVPVVTGIIGGGLAAGQASQEYAEDYYVKNYGMRGYKGGVDSIWAATHGAISGYIESKLGVDNLIKNVFSKTGIKELKKGALKNIGMAALGEAGEEILQETSGSLFGSIVGSEDRTFGEFLQDALTNAAYGALVGGVFGSGTYYTARTKLIKQFKKSGYSDEEARNLADTAIDDTKGALLKEIATSTSLRANVGEAFDTLVDKIETALNAAGFQDTHTGLSVHEYAVVNASDIASQVIRQARSANVPTADILDLAQIEVVDNAIWLKPQELGTAQDINKRVKDLDKQIRDINSQLRVQSDLRQQLREDKNLTNTLKSRKAGLKRQRDLLKRLYNSKVGIEQEQKEKLTLSKQRYMKKVNPTADVNSFDTVVRKQAYDDVKLLSEDIRALSSNLERQKNAVIAYLAGDDTQLFDNMVLSGKQNIQRGVNSAIESINELMSDPELLNEYRGALKLASDMTLKSQFEEIVADNATFGSSAILHELVHKGSATGLIQSYTAKKQANKDGNNRLGKKGVFNDDDLYYQALKEQNPDSFDGDHCTSKSLTAVLMSRMNQFDNAVDNIPVVQPSEQSVMTGSDVRRELLNKSKEIKREDLLKKLTQSKLGDVLIIDTDAGSQAVWRYSLGGWVVSNNVGLKASGASELAPKYFYEFIEGLSEKLPGVDIKTHFVPKELADPIFDKASESGLLFQTDLADENARLDDIYPEYTGETIEVNGVERTVYNSNGERIAKSEPALRNFWNWFGDSKVVDDKGRPLVVYHGARGKTDITEFDPKKGWKVDATYFATNPSAAAHWSIVSSETKRVFDLDSFTKKIKSTNSIEKLLEYYKIFRPEAHLSQEYNRFKNENWWWFHTTNYDVGKPLGAEINEKEFVDKLQHDILYYAKGAVESDLYGVYVKLQKPLIVDAKKKSYHNILFNDDRVNTEKIVDYAQSNNYDGVIVKNVYETDYENVLTDDIIAFESTQIKSVDNHGTYSPDTGNIYYQRTQSNGYYDAELKVIVLGRNMNTMTLPHEMAHFWLDNTFSMFKKASKGELNIGQQWIDETNTLFSILGIDPQQETLTSSQQETFATMTEAVITGLAPVPDGATLPMTEYLNWIPEKYKSIAQIGFRNENGMIVHPVLDQSAVDFFNVWYGNMTLPPIPSSPARDSMTNPRDENGEIIPSTTETMQEREKTIKKAIKDQESADESAQDQRKANQSSAEQAETAGALAVYDSAEQEKPSLPRHESWLKAGRGTNTREQLAKAARNYVKKNPDHAREVAQGNPFTTENDTGVDRESLILAVMEMDNITYGTELGVLYEHNIALSRSRAGTELGTHSRTGSYQMYLDAYRRIEAAMTEKAAYKYAGRGAGAVDKFNSDIDALIIKWADKVFSQGMDIGVALRGMMAEASVQFTGEEGVLHQLDLTQAGKTRQVFIAYANRLIKQDIAKAQPNAELQRKLLEMAPKAEKAAIDLNSSDITVAKNAALALRDWSNLVRSEDVSQSMLGKAINTWAPRAMLSGISTHVTNIVSNSIEQTMVRGAIASHYGENIVPQSELDNETARIKTVYNESGMNLTTMITSSDPSLVHGEKYKPLDPKAKTKAIDPLQWLSMEDNLFRIPTYIDVLSRMASRDANGDVNKAKELFRQYASTQPKKINGQDNPLYKKRQEAILVASMATFTQNGKLAGALNKMRDALNQISFEGRSLQLGTMIAPFVKTPANIIESGLRAPYGALKTAYKKLTGGEITIEDAVDTAHFIGFALVGIIAAAFCDYEPPYKGGKYDPNKPYDSIEIMPGVWVKIDTLGVIESPLRLLLSMRDGATGAGIKQTISATPLIGELTDGNLNYALNDPLNYAGGLAYNQIGKLTPTIARQIAKPIIRETGLSIDANTNLGRKFARRWGLDESENTVNDFIGLLFNRIKITE